MATVTDLAKLPIPVGSNGPNLAADIAALARAVDARLVLLAANQSERDAEYFDAKAGTLVVTPDGWMWLKTSSPPKAATWLTLQSVETYTDFTWNTAQGWSDSHSQDQVQSKITKVGCHFDLSIECYYTGATRSATDITGWFQDLNICRINDERFRPDSRRAMATWGGYQFSGWTMLWLSGAINLTDARGEGRSIESGETLNMCTSWIRMVD